MRGKQAPKRELAPDMKYGNPLVTKLINYVMLDGKKTTARKIVYTAFEKAEKELKKPAMEIFETVMKNVTPSVEVRSKRVGGANYQIPTPVRGNRRHALAFRWILNAVRGKKGRPIADRLAEELIAIYQGEGEAMKKKAEVQRQADANRAFAHFARR